MRKLLTILILFTAIGMSNANDNNFNVMDVNTSDSITQKYPRQLGNVRISANYVDMGIVHKNEKKVYELGCFNNSKDTITLSVRRAPVFISVVIDPKIIPPGEKGKINVSYDVTKNSSWGREADRLYLKVDDSVHDINVMATIIEDFTNKTEAELENAPLLSIDEPEFDFGKIREGEKVKGKFIIKNEGENELLIRNVETSSSCLRLEYSENAASGDSLEIRFILDSKGLRLRQAHNIAVVTNDPKNPIVNLRLIGYISN